MLTCTAHFGGIASGLDLEFPHRVKRRAQVECIECRVGIGRAVKQEIVGVQTIPADAQTNVERQLKSKSQIIFIR